ncbi:MAG: hypothetical protein H6835_19460 [Planctomycetes bacterium]|nr:hypothetical protein [Planctomycetota bacterium]
MEQRREPDVPPELVPCVECGAGNAASAAFCVGCGVSMRTKRSRGPRAASGRRRATPEQVEASRARHEFARIKGSVLALRAVYWAGTVLAVVYLLIGLALGAALGGVWAILLPALGCLQLGLMVAGALLVVRAPLAWAIVGASYCTLDALLVWWLNDFAFPPGLAVRLLMVVAFWCVVGQAARVQRLMAEHPELQLVRRRIAPDRRAIGGVADEARQRRADERRRATAAQNRLFAILAAVAVIGIGAAIYLSLPPAADDTVARFAERWAAGDTAAIGNMFKDAQLRRDGAELRDDLTQRGWLPAPPALTLGELQEDGDVAIASFTGPGGGVRAKFRRDAAGWHLDGVTLPRVEVTALRPGIDAFRAAWQAKGTEALVAMFRPDSQARAGASLARILDKRGWTDGRPALGDASPTGTDHPKVTVRFELDGDELQVRFEFWHPEWKVTGVRMPRE